MDGAATARSLWLPKRLPRDQVMVRSTTTSRSVSITVEKSAAPRPAICAGRTVACWKLGIVSGQVITTPSVRRNRSSTDADCAPGLAMPIVVSKKDDDEPSAR